MAKKVNYEEFSRDEILDDIMKKKEFSQLPREDVGLVYSQFEKREASIEEKIKLSRDLLRKMYTAFVSDRLLNIKDKEPEWFLKKHISTKERMDYYEEIYSRTMLEFKDKKINVFDFGCGINGFGYEYFKKVGLDVNYVGCEPVGQLVDLQNNYFEKNKLNAKCEKISLFNLEGNLNLIKKYNGVKVAFFFKVLDSLEMLKRNYSKDVLSKIVPIVDRVVVSWATRSLVSHKKFHAERKWLKDFVSENFKIIDEFESGTENYLVFCKK